MKNKIEKEKDKDSDDNNKKRIYTIINYFKNLLEIQEDDKFHSISNSKSEKKVNFFHKESFNSYDNDSLFYYNPFPEVKNSIFFVAIISFHHKKGSIVEYTFPSKEYLLNNSILLEILNNDKNISKENILENIFYQLTNFCLPDGIHLQTIDNQFFIINNFNYPLYGISCYRQINSLIDNTSENTRHFIQKSFCLVTILPLYSLLYLKLSMTLEAYFNQKNLQEKGILEELFNNFSDDKYYVNINMNEMFVIFNLGNLINFTKEKIFLIIKAILLEKKIIIYSKVSSNVCCFIYSLLSLFPGQILFNFNSGENIRNYLKYINSFGMPLKIFNKNYNFYNLMSLYEIDKIDKNQNYLLTTTNTLILDEYSNLKNCDLLINIDTNKINVFNSILKDMNEPSKIEKKIYNNIHNYLKTNNIKYDKENWINIFNKNNSNNKNNNVLIDDYIRNEFTNYFKNFLIDIDLCINILKNNNNEYINLIYESFNLNVQKKLLINDKSIKKVYKKILNNYNIDFILYWIRTLNFKYFISQHDKNLFLFSKHLNFLSNTFEFFFENYIYYGQIKNGLKEGNGIISSYDNKYNYEGEFLNDMKNGYGKLVDNNKGIQYSGNFVNDNFQGKGILIDKLGNIYDGEFLNNKYEGYGNLKLGNGEEYKGYFKLGLFDGKGKYKYKDGSKYEGQFEKGKKNGKGKLIKKDGEKYEGTFIDDNFFC